MKSIIRWVGGKGRIMQEVMKEFPPAMNTYYEPFVGGGSVLLTLIEKKLTNQCIVGDSNEELINFYLQLKIDYKKVIDEFNKLENSKEEFFRVRVLDRDPDWLKTDPMFRAARFLYITKMSFNGLWRVNQKGYNNSPFGRIDKITYSEQEIKQFAEMIQNTEFKVSDFADLVAGAKEGDFVYMDPPYVPISETASFTRYVKEDFGEKEHQKLRATCDILNDKKVNFLVSNSSCDRTRKLFEGYNIVEIDVRRSVAATNTSRGEIKEFLIKNY